jgi:peptidoglycan hydrolase CwlO-like protein
LETTGQLPNINTSIENLTAQVDNLANKIEILCSLADLFQRNMEKAGSNVESLENLLARVVKIERAAMGRLRALA